MKRFELTAAAKSDLNAIADYLKAEAGTVVAQRLAIKFRDTFRDLASVPGTGHYREDILDTRYRFWNVFSYQIVYLWQKKPIQIVAVVHGSRDLQAFFARRLPV